MLSKCANPRCGVPFRYMHEGRLFHIRAGALHEEDTLTALLRPAAQTSFHHYWLCASCALRYDIIAEGDGTAFHLTEKRFRNAG